MGPYIWALIDWIGISAFAWFPISVILRRVRKPERYAFIGLLGVFPAVAGSVAQVDGYDTETQMIAVGVTWAVAMILVFILRWQHSQPHEPGSGDSRGVR